MHKVISLYQNNLPNEVMESQRKVFEHFGITLEQVCFSENRSHANAILENLNKPNWDSVTIFDVDCIPITKDCIYRAKENINMHRDIHDTNKKHKSNVFQRQKPPQTSVTLPPNSAVRLM